MELLLSTEGSGKCIKGSQMFVQQEGTRGQVYKETLWNFPAYVRKRTERSARKRKYAVGTSLAGKLIPSSTI